MVNTEVERSNYLHDLITRLRKLSGGEMQFVLSQVGIDANLTTIVVDEDLDLKEGGKTPQ